MAEKLNQFLTITQSLKGCHKFIESEKRHLVPKHVSFQKSFKEQCAREQLAQEALGEKLVESRGRQEWVREPD